MSRKSILEPYSIVTAGDMSANITSPDTSVKNLDQITYEIVWSGIGVNGEIQVQTQVKDVWQTIDLPVIPVDVNAGNHLITINAASHFQKLRIVYNRTGGTGSMTVTIIGAVLGA